MYCKAELRFYFYCTNQNGLLQSKESGAVRKGQVLSGDLVPLWPWACESVLFILFPLYRFYFCLESPYKVPKGMYISCVARKHHHVCLWTSNPVAVEGRACLLRFSCFIDFRFSCLRPLPLQSLDCFKTVT